MEIESRKRDLNSRMRGSEEFTKAALPDGDAWGPLRWLSDIEGTTILRDTWGPVGIRASERRCSTVVDAPLPEGTIIVSIERVIPKSGGAKLSAGIVRGDEIAWLEDGGIKGVHSVRSGAGWITRVTFDDGRTVDLGDA